MKTMRNGPAFGSTQLYGRRSTGVRSVQEKVTMSRFPQSGAAIIPAHSRRGAFGTHSTDLSDGVDPVTRTEGGASRFPLLPGSFGSVLLALALPLLFPITLIAQPDEKPMVPPVVPVTAPVTSPVVAPATAPVAVDTNETKTRVSEPVPVPAPTTMIEELRPDEPVDLALETYLRRSGVDTSLFTPRSLPAAPLLDEQEQELLVRQGRRSEGAIPMRGYPAADDRPRPRRPFYLEGSFGLHTTASVVAGLSGTTWPFDYRAAVDVATTEGSFLNGEQHHIALEAGAGYIIGNNYGIFSGGYMGGDAAWRTSSYRLHALADAPERTAIDWHLGAESQASIGPIALDGAARIGRFVIEEERLNETGLVAGEQSTFAATSFAAEASARLSQGILDWNGRLALGDVVTDLGDMPTASLSLGLALDLGFLRLGAGGRIDASGSTDIDTDSRITPTAELRIDPFDGFALIGNLGGGLHATDPAEIFGVNRYAALDGPWRPEIEKLGYGLTLLVEPSPSFNLRATASRRDFDRYLHFGPVVDGRFAPIYEALRLDQAEADFFLRLGEKDELALLLRYADGLRADGTALPYIPRYDGTLGYRHRLLGSPYTFGGSFRMIGERTGAAAATLDPVLLVSLDGEYALGDHLDLFLEVRNLLDASYERWSGYREEGFGGGIGIRGRW